MSINIWTDSMQHAELLGKPVLFTNWLIQRDIIPDGWYCYDLRGTHKSPSTRTTLVDHAADYHAGTVLSPIPLKHEGTAGSMAAPSQRTAGIMAILRKQKITVSAYAVLPSPASIRGTSIAMIFASRRCTDRNTLWWVG